MIKHAILSALAALSIGAFVLLGNATSTSIAGTTMASLPAQTSLVGSSAEAALFSAPARLGVIVDAARAAVRSQLGDVGQRLVRRFGQQADVPFPSRAALQAAEDYGISPHAAQAILDSPELRRAIADAPFDGGAVKFSFENLYELRRPLETLDPKTRARILVDVDNVVGAYWEQFRKEVAAFLNIDKRDLPANPSSYDWVEGSDPIRAQFFSGEPLSPNLVDFRDWMEANSMLEGFLKSDPEFFDVFNPFHRYFVEKGLYRNMDAFPGAREGLESLRDIWDIGIVTKRWGHDPVKYGWTHQSVPSDSARWISEATGNAFDSLTVMGENKADFAGHVRVVFEDSVGNIEKIRIQNAPMALREKAFAAGIAVDKLDEYLAHNNTEVLGVVFRFGYNEKHSLLSAPNVVAVDSWDQAHAVARAYHELLTNPEAGASGRLHSSAVPGLTNEDGTRIASFGGKLIAEDAPRKSHVLQLNGYVPGQGLPYGMGGYDNIPEHLMPGASKVTPQPSGRPDPGGLY